LTVGEAVWLIEEIARLGHQLATTPTPDPEVQVAWQRRHDVLFDAPGFVGLERFAKYELGDGLTPEAASEFRCRLAKLPGKSFLDDIDSMPLAAAVSLLGQPEAPAGQQAPPPEGDQARPPAGPDRAHGKRRTHRKRRQAATRTAARRRGGNKTPEPPAELPELVNLSQAAAFVNRTANGLRHYRNHGMPKPFIRGTKGQPNQYLWSEMRPWLESQFNRPIPEVSILKFRSSGR
jgi:hypothetical protein